MNPQRLLFLAMFCAGLFLGVPRAALADEAAPAAADVSPAKAAKIRELLALIGTQKQAEMMLDQMMSSFAKALPGQPPAFWETLKQKMDIGELIDQIVPVYAKYYSDADLDGLIAFYKSPLGQKMISVQGPLMRESMQIGQKWGAGKGAAAMQEVQKAKAESAPASVPAPGAGS
jgi:hypothetical protein